MNRLFDENGKLFGKVSVIDILAVLLVLALAFAVVQRFVKLQELSREIVAVEENVSYDFQININGVRSMTVDALQVGDTLYDSNTGNPIGIIEDMVVNDSVQEVLREDGSYVVDVAQDRYDVLLTIAVVEGEIRDGRYYTQDDLEIRVNGYLGVHTKYCITTGTIWSIDRRAA